MRVFLLFVLLFVGCASSPNCCDCVCDANGCECVCRPDCQCPADCDCNGCGWCEENK